MKGTKQYKLRLIVSAARARIRRAFVAALARYFYIVPVPASFDVICEESRDYTVVTESRSLIVEALLYSFAKRSRLRDVIHLGANSLQVRAPETVYWVANFEQEALQAIVSAFPTQKFVTLNIFSGRGPYRNNPTYTLGFWDLFGILIMGRFLIIFFGTPIEASPTLTSIHSSLIRHLRVDFYKNLKLVRGSPFHSIETQAKLVMGGQEFISELEQVAEKTRTPLPTLARRAEKAFYDVAANPRRPMYRLVAFIARIIIRRLFSAVRTVGLERLVAAVKESTVVIVPMHRSHLDYILVGSKLYESNLNPPLVAAGINLSFWPVGFIIRSVGGYFVKRNVRNDRLHALVLKRYVTYLVKRGHLQEFFIEGGRSRSGKMRSPKIGLLSIFIEAYLKGYKKDILFVPVSITYDNVVEDAVFGQENTGQSKEKENLFALIKARKIFRQQHGEVIINFGDAVSLREFLDKRPASRSSRRDSRGSVTELAYKITVAIREQTNPSLTSLAHTALLMAPRYGLTRATLIEAIKNLSRLLNEIRPAHPQMGEHTASLDLFLSGKEGILNDIGRGGSIKIYPCAGSDVFVIPGERRFIADFYKNSTIHLFLETGLLSILDLLKRSPRWEDIKPFYSLLRHDFLLGEEDVFKSGIYRTIELLSSAGILKASNERIEFSDRSFGIFIPTLLFPTLQSLAWCLRQLSQEAQKWAARPTDGGEGPAIIDYDEILATMQGEFRAAVYAGQMHSTEASSLASLTAALDSLAGLGIISITERLPRKKKIILQKPAAPELEQLKAALQALTRWHLSPALLPPENFAG
ncbi:MAG: 1-acyl-sn-glycerol-3-phosphate acyltransferase [Deltaproteobacteria bacterium]|nr:1-acyl-sn-glycerol-3-phosphate acyltransferase [Deltaproteobacteria bacterium]